jgi:hypothetical protein
MGTSSLTPGTGRWMLLGAAALAVAVGASLAACSAGRTIAETRPALTDQQRLANVIAAASTQIPSTREDAFLALASVEGTGPVLHVVVDTTYHPAPIPTTGRDPRSTTGYREELWVDPAKGWSRYDNTSPRGTSQQLDKNGVHEVVQPDLAMVEAARPLHGISPVNVDYPTFFIARYRELLKLGIAKVTGTSSEQGVPVQRLTASLRYTHPLPTGDILPTGEEITATVRASDLTPLTTKIGEWEGYRPPGGPVRWTLMETTTRRYTIERLSESAAANAFATPVIPADTTVTASVYLTPSAAAKAAGYPVWWVGLRTPLPPQGTAIDAIGVHFEDGAPALRPANAAGMDGRFRGGMRPASRLLPDRLGGQRFSVSYGNPPDQQYGSGNGPFRAYRTGPGLRIVSYPPFALKSWPVWGAKPRRVSVGARPALLFSVQGGRQPLLELLVDMGDSTVDLQSVGYTPAQLIATAGKIRPMP